MKRFLFIPLALGVSACGVLTSPIVGEYNDAAEVLTGEVVFDPLQGDGALFLTGERSGLRCEGDIWANNTGADPVTCRGMTGDFLAFCDDGRRIEGDWRARSCSAGAATGKDTRGEDLSFFFGADRDAADAFLAAARRRADLREALPVTRPAAGVAANA
ncbi:MAG: hypothetical protein AAF684_05575, partial [Pseudomonadota bacterium]